MLRRISWAAIGHCQQSNVWHGAYSIAHACLMYMHVSPISLLAAICMHRPLLIHHDKHVQDDDNCEVVPGTDFIVSRTAHRNNSSVYYIGSRKTSFGEVTDLLKGKGIDLDNNRFLILQVRLGILPDGKGTQSDGWQDCITQC